MALTLLLAVVLGSPFWHLGHPLWEVDDARYAEVPREMHEKGDWLTPRLNYMHYVEKPPLIYWLGAASYRLFGVGERSARLPLALLAVLGILGVWWLGSWLFDPVTGRWAALILGTSAEYFLLGHLLTPDMAVSVFLLWATGLTLRCLLRPQDSAWASPLAWLAMTLAFLSKGLIGALLPAAWTALLVWLFPGARKGLKGLLLGWGLPFFLAAAGGWLFLMESRHPGFLHHFIVEQHFRRFLTPAYSRPGPWYFFLGVDAAALLPWTPLAMAATLLPALRWRRTDERLRQLCLWVWLLLAFFSLSHSKLATYILPILAHQALLGARLLASLERGSATARRLSRAAALLAGSVLLCVLAVPAAVGHLPLPAAPDPGLFACAVLLLLCLSGALACLAKAAAWTGEAALSRAGVLACAMNALLLFGSGYLTPMLSARDIAADLKACLREGDRVFSYKVYLHGIPFYTRRPVDVVVDWVEELHYAKRDPAFRPRFGDEPSLTGLLRGPGRSFVVLERRDLQGLLALAPRKPRDLRSHGVWILAEF